MAGPSASGYTGSMRYRVSVPISRVSGSTVTRTIYAALRRHSTTVSLGSVSMSFPAGETKSVQFDVTSDTNLTNWGTSYDYYLDIWSTDATSSNKVYIMPTEAKIKITSGSAQLTDDECTIHYIP